MLRQDKREKKSRVYAEGDSVVCKYESHEKQLLVSNFFHLKFIFFKKLGDKRGGTP